DRNRSHWSTSKTPSYTKSVSWQHHQHGQLIINGLALTFISLRMIFFLVFRAAQDSNEAT
ncbi:hypothetical protein, partial [Escherichia sp. AM3]|uniref:hypothetical protein n=1 Tax=Escherichia sp. AM3 TaxID=3070702 RepID=UPI00289C14CB